MGASAEAADFYTEALSIDMPDRVRAEIHYKAGLAFAVRGLFDEALDNWRKALSIYEELNEPESIGDICSEISRTLLWGSRNREAFEIVNKGMSILGDSVSASRSLMMAASGHVYSYLPEQGYDTPNAMFEQALAMAETLGEKELEGLVLCREAMFHRNYWQGSEVVECAQRSLEILRKGNKPFDTANALLAAEWGLMHVGRLAEATAMESELEGFAPKSGAELNRSMLDIYQCLRRVIIDGDLERFETRIAEALEECIQLRWSYIYLDYSCLGTAQFWRGNWELAEETFRKASVLLARFVVIPAYMGKRDKALQVLSKIKKASATLEQYDDAAALYPLAQEAVATGNLIQPFCSGLVQTTAGIAAAAGKLWERAEEHFETALRQAHEIPHVIEQPEVRRWYARMLMKTGTLGDLDRAHQLLKEAIELYEKIKMPKHIAMAQNLMERVESMKTAQPG
jgi:tetratricopeptide (TPR) repeat protein